MTKTREQEVADTILNQLGGSGKLRAMTGAHTFISHPDKCGGLSFKIKSRSTNYIKIILNGKDLYDLEFGRIWGMSYKVKAEYTDIYADQLVSIIEKETGMYLSL